MAQNSEKQQKDHRRVQQKPQSPIYPGEACKELNITASALECVARAEYNACSLRYKRSLPVSNAVILELRRFKARKNYSWEAFKKWLCAIFGITKLEKEYPTSNALIRSVTSKYAKHRQMVIKRQTEERLKFEKLEYFPTVSVPSTTIDLHCTCQELTEEITKLKREFKKQEEEKHKLEKRLKQHSTRNINKRIKRRDHKVLKLSKEVREKDLTISYLRNLIDETKKLLTTKVQKAESYKRKWQYWKQKAKEIDTIEGSDVDIESEGEEDMYVEKVVELRKEISELEQMNIELNEMLEEQNVEITTFQGGKFITEVNEVCLDMMSRNVAIQHISPIIRSVLTKLAKRDCGRLPAPSTLAELASVAKLVTYQQVGEKLSEAEHTTLHSDGTTKFGSKYIGFQVATEDSCYSIGLADMKAGTAAFTLEIFQNILYDIESVCQSEDSVASLILAKIQNTMSDRHVVQKTFNQLLQEYREEVLPSVIEDWEKLASDEREVISSMNNFYCGMHFMTGLADTANECLKEWERLHAEDDSLPDQSKDSGTVTLIRLVCKAVQRHGSEQCGVYAPFSQYLRMNDITSVPLAKFKGNRFNIVFHDGAGVYYLHKHLQSFFSSIYGTPNRLLQTVFDNIQVPQYLAGCKALGIINKYISRPLWRKLESKISITEMSRAYQDMYDKFKEWANDSSDLLTGNDLLFPDIPLKGDVLTELLSPSPYDDLATECLQIMFKSFVSLMERLLQDHLDGGKFSESSSELSENTRSVPCTNTISERDFAQLDRFLRMKPNATTLALEGVILYANNKTSQWLSEKSREEQEKIISAAKRIAPKHKALFKERREQIKQYKAQQLREKAAEIERKRRREEQEREELLAKIDQLGYWRSVSTVNSKLRQFHYISQKKEALKAQIKYRKIILQQTADSSLFKFSENRKVHSIEKLSSNLCELIKLSASNCSGEYMEERLSKRHRTALDPADFVGKVIDHRFKEPDGSLSWYRGIIEKQIGGRNSWTFEIGYDCGDKEEYNIEVDYSEGDVVIVQQ